MSKNARTDRRILARARRKEDGGKRGNSFARHGGAHSERPVSEGIRRAAKRAGIEEKPDLIPAAIREAAARHGVNIPKGTSLDDLNAEQLTAVAICGRGGSRGRRPQADDRARLGTDTGRIGEGQSARAEKYGPLHVEMVKLAVQFDQRGDGCSKGVAGLSLDLRHGGARRGHTGGGLRDGGCLAKQLSI